MRQACLSINLHARLAWPLGQSAGDHAGPLPLAAVWPARLWLALAACYAYMAAGRAARPLTDLARAPLTGCTGPGPVGPTRVPPRQLAQKLRTPRMDISVTLEVLKLVKGWLKSVRSKLSAGRKDCAEGFHHHNERCVIYCCIITNQLLFTNVAFFVIFLWRRKRLRTKFAILRNRKGLQRSL